MKRIRVNNETWELLEGLQEPGEMPADTLRRLLKVRYRESAYPNKAGLSYKELAARWGCSVSLVKIRVRQWRESGGKVGLGPVRKIGARKVIVPWDAITKYEEGGVY